MKKSEREEREYKSLFTDERYAKSAWKSIIGSSLQSSGEALEGIYDPKTGEPTLNTQIDKMAYTNVKKRLKDQGLDREPMQAELIIECNVIRARFTESSFNILLDRTAGKVKDEVAVTTSPFEDLTDEELEILAQHRAKEKKNKK